MSGHVNKFFGTDFNSNMYAGLMEAARRVSEDINSSQLPLDLKLASPPVKQPRMYTVSRDASRGGRGSSKFGAGGQVGKENVGWPGHNYGGAFYSNRVCCSCQIVLMGIGFHGPAEVDVAKYNVRIEIFAQDAGSKRIFPTGHPNQCIFKWHWKGVTGQRGEIFHIDLETPLAIQAGKWYLIQFMLEGEPTGRCMSTLTQVSVPIEAGNESVEFSFNHGSMQMPELKFSV